MALCQHPVEVMHCCNQYLNNRIDLSGLGPDTTGAQTTKVTNIMTQQNSNRASRAVRVPALGLEGLLGGHGFCAIYMALALATSFIRPHKMPSYEGRLSILSNG